MPDSPSLDTFIDRWQPIKVQLDEANDPTDAKKNLAIRVHRALSWLGRAAALKETARGRNRKDDPSLDDRLIFRWIAFNALYGQWDDRRNEAVTDRQAYGTFLDRLLQLDDGHLVSVLEDEKKLVTAICSDRFLSNHFWKDPSVEEGRKEDRARFKARDAYRETRWSALLDQLVGRVYLVRCQLVHGAATHSGSLNRDLVWRCDALLGHLVLACLNTLADHGLDTDWGDLCYPPIHG